MNSNNATIRDMAGESLRKRIIEGCFISDYKKFFDSFQSDPKTMEALNKSIEAAKIATLKAFRQKNQVRENPLTTEIAHTHQSTFYPHNREISPIRG